MLPRSVAEKPHRRDSAVCNAGVGVASSTLTPAHAIDARVEWHGVPQSGHMSPVADCQTKRRIPLMYFAVYATLACLPLLSIE